MRSWILDKYGLCSRKKITSAMVGTEAVAAFLPVADEVEICVFGHGHNIDQLGTDEFAGAAGGDIVGVAGDPNGVDLVMGEYGQD